MDKARAARDIDIRAWCGQLTRGCCNVSRYTLIVSVTSDVRGHHLGKCPDGVRPAELMY